MIIFDSNFLIALLHPNVQPPKDEKDKPVEKFRERIEELVNNLNAEGTLIGIPTPVVAEILARYTEGKEEYIETLRNRHRFDLLPFGVKAAIEASDLIAIIKDEQRGQAKKDKSAQEGWHKVKFDIQITAIAKAEDAAMLYADDKGVVNHAKRLKIPVKRICELPLPKEKPQTALATENSGQAKMFEEMEPEGGTQ